MPTSQPPTVDGGRSKPSPFWTPLADGPELDHPLTASEHLRLTADMLERQAALEPWRRERGRILASTYRAAGAAAVS